MDKSATLTWGLTLGKAKGFLVKTSKFYLPFPKVRPHSKVQGKKIKKANQTLQVWIQNLSRATNWNAPQGLGSFQAWLKFQLKGQTFCAWNDAWHKCLSKVQGSKDARRASRISNTVNELRTQLTPQFAKSASSASGSARTQAGATHAPGGFTIAELLIATSIFSIVLLVGAAAVTQLGRSYYKGVTVTQTQQVAKQIMQNVSSNIRLSSTVSPINSASDNRQYYCVGGHRYSFKLFNLVSTSDHDNSTKFGLIADEPNGDGCGNPFDGSAPLVKPAELLGNNMRLLAFSITAVGASTTTYTVNVTVAFGADNVLSDPNSPDAQCQGSGNITQFCAITRLSSVVYQGTNI